MSKSAKLDESKIEVRSAELDAVELSWFAPLCSDDYRYLGHPESDLKSSFTHTSNILLQAEKNGFRNILCPSSYQVGQDTLAFASAVAPMTSSMNLLVAIRCGEVHPPMLARAISTLDHILRGRLTINIISSDLPGEKIPSEKRYARSKEVIQILQQAWSGQPIKLAGEFYNLDLASEPVLPYQQNGGPLLYFGGYSPAAKKLCAQFCDVYLMWPETPEVIGEQMAEMSAYAREFDRKIDFGFRSHVVVRETEAEARDHARSLLSKLDLDVGKAIKERAQDAASLGVAKQGEVRNRSDAEGYVGRHLFTGIGLARSGCGAAIVGDPDQVYQELEKYRQLGVRSFVLSGYPHLDECDLFAKYVLPKMKTCSMPEVQNRIPKEAPHTPLAAGVRK